MMSIAIMIMSFLLYLIILFMMIIIYTIGFAIINMLRVLLKDKDLNVNIWEHFIIVLILQRSISLCAALLSIYGTEYFSIPGILHLIGCSYAYSSILIIVFEVAVFVVCFIMNKICKDLVRVWIISVIISLILTAGYTIHKFHFMFF